MRIQFAVLRIIVFVVLARTCSFAEAQKIVKRVVIQSGAGGLEASLNTRVVIKRKGSKFLTRAVFYSITIGQPNGLKTRVVKKREGGKLLSKDRPVSAVQVQALVDALSAAPMIVPDSKNLGITDEWLAAKIESLRPRNVTASQKSFITLTLIDSVLPNLLIDPQTFDYSVFCGVVIVFDDGSKLSAESHFYSVVFMLPWSMNGGRETYTYNADISRAIAALLPAESPNKTKLAGDELDTELTAIVKTSIETEWNSLGPQ